MKLIEWMSDIGGCSCNKIDSDTENPTSKYLAQYYYDFLSSLTDRELKAIKSFCGDWAFLVKAHKNRRIVIDSEKLFASVDKDVNIIENLIGRVPPINKDIIVYLDEGNKVASTREIPGWMKIRVLRGTKLLYLGSLKLCDSNEEIVFGL